MRAIIWALSFLPVALFTGLVLDRMSDTLPPNSATRSLFIVGLLVVTTLAAATVKRALVNALERRRQHGTSAL